MEFEGLLQTGLLQRLLEFPGGRVLSEGLQHALRPGFARQALHLLHEALISEGLIQALFSDARGLFLKAPVEFEGLLEFLFGLLSHGLGLGDILHGPEEGAFRVSAQDRVGLLQQFLGEMDRLQDLEGMAAADDPVFQGIAGFEADLVKDRGGVLHAGAREREELDEVGMGGQRHPGPLGAQALDAGHGQGPALVVIGSRPGFVQQHQVAGGDLLVDPLEGAGVGGERREVPAEVLAGVHLHPDSAERRDAR